MDLMAYKRLSHINIFHYENNLEELATQTVLSILSRNN